MGACHKNKRWIDGLDRPHDAQLAIRGTHVHAEADAGAGDRNDTLPEAETEMAAKAKESGGGQTSDWKHSN